MARFPNPKPKPSPNPDPKPNPKPIPKPDPKPNPNPNPNPKVRAELLAAAAAKRKDAALRNVVISEKRDKKAAAFTTSGVPFPFKTREQFERSVRAPLGPEWNPAASHAALTKPKVHTLKGVIIDPLADHHKRQAGAEPKGKPKASKRTKR